MLLSGTSSPVHTPDIPYSEKVCEFLDAFSRAIRKQKKAKTMADVMTFAFFIRRGNLEVLKREYKKKHGNEIRMGRGLVFHIAPSNVPMNCMYTYVFGLLSGNANIVRVPSKNFAQVDVLLEILEGLFKLDEFQEIKERTSFVRYDRTSDETVGFSRQCDVRVIWGGDDTIKNIRKAEISPRAKEITFADRYSFGVISAKAVVEADEEELGRLARDFYNDTWLMDQNACSTPHLICWRKDVNVELLKKGKEKFWNACAKEAVRYEAEDVKMSEKLLLLLESVIGMPEVILVKRYGDNRLFVCQTDQLSDQCTEKLRGKYGLFFEYEFENFDELLALNDDRVQTCAYYGIAAEKLADFVGRYSFRGIDRIVPFGKTLDIGPVWDGYDLISEMSRVVSVSLNRGE